MDAVLSRQSGMSDDFSHAEPPSDPYFDDRVSNEAPQRGRYDTVDDSNRAPYDMYNPMHRATDASEQEFRKNWFERRITKIDAAEKKLVRLFPNICCQDSLDKLGAYIEKKFGCFSQFNEWLKENDAKSWYSQFAVFLLKFPLRAAFNIVDLLYQIVRTAICSVVHPAKAVIKLARFVVNLIQCLTFPETWACIGGGLVGFSLGHALTSGNPLALIGIAIGGALSIAGFTLSALKTAIQAEKGQGAFLTKELVKGLLPAYADAMATGFLAGLLFGAILRAVDRVHTTEKISKILR